MPTLANVPANVNVTLLMDGAGTATPLDLKNVDGIIGLIRQTASGSAGTVKVQHSNDNAVSDAYADVPGGGVMAEGALLALDTAVLKRWIKVVKSGGGFAVAFAITVPKYR